jgi:hypothetical protein
VLEITNMQRVIMHEIPAKLRNTPQEKYCFIKEQIIRDCYSDLSFKKIKLLRFYKHKLMLN